MTHHLLRSLFGLFLYLFCAMFVTHIFDPPPFLVYQFSWNIHLLLRKQGEDTNLWLIMWRNPSQIRKVTNKERVI